MEAAKVAIRTTLDEHRRLSGSPLSAVTSLRAPGLVVGQCVDLVVSKVLEFGVLLSQVRGEPYQSGVITPVLHVSQNFLAIDAGGL